MFFLYQIKMVRWLSNCKSLIKTICCCGCLNVWKGRTIRAAFENEPDNRFPTLVCKWLGQQTVYEIEHVQNGKEADVVFEFVEKITRRERTYRETKSEKTPVKIIVFPQGSDEEDTNSLSFTWSPMQIVTNERQLEWVKRLKEDMDEKKWVFLFEICGWIWKTFEETLYHPRMKRSNN